MRFFVIAAPAVLLAACASTDQRTSPYQAEYEQLRQECIASGGSFIPLGTNTGRVATDYVCQRRDGGSRLD